MKEFSLTNQPYDEIIPKMVSEINTKSDETYVINYDAHFANSKIIRDFVGEIFNIFKIPTPWHGRFVLITDELVNNSIEHGSREGDTNRCVITTKMEWENLFRVSVEVHDTGNGESLKSIDEMTEKKDETTHENAVYMGKRGRGLFHITEKIVDKLTFWKSDQGGLMVKIEKCINTKNESCTNIKNESVGTSQENVSKKQTKETSEN